jgi:competence protein ComEC
MPAYAVISCGKNNSYGHPTEGTLSKLRDAGVKVFRTDMQGDIVAVSDGNAVTFTPTRNSNANTLNGLSTSSTASASKSTTKTTNTTTKNNAKPVAANYIGNVNTLKFHLPSCSYLPNPENQTTFKSRDAAINAGYVPCKRCNP